MIRITSSLDRSPSSGWLRLIQLSVSIIRSFNPFCFRRILRKLTVRPVQSARAGGPAAVRRGYVYFSEVPPMPGLDLISLDRLWTVYSQGRFGFSTQARLLKDSTVTT